MPDHGNGNSEGYRRDLRDHFHLPLYGGGRLGADATAAALAWAGVLEEPPPVAACETRKRRRAAQARELGVEEMVGIDPMKMRGFKRFSRTSNRPWSFVRGALSVACSYPIVVG